MQVKQDNEVLKSEKRKLEALLQSLLSDTDASNANAYATHPPSFPSLSLHTNMASETNYFHVSCALTAPTADH